MTSTTTFGSGVTGKELLSPSQVAELLKVTTNTLAIWRFHRRGPSYLKIGRQVRYPLEDIEQFLDASVRSCDPEIRDLGSR